MNPVANLDGIIDVVVRPPLVGVLDHADIVIDDFHAIRGKVGDDTHEGLIYDNSAYRWSAEILFDKTEDRIPIVSRDGARCKRCKVALGNLGGRVEN